MIKLYSPLNEMELALAKKVDCIDIWESSKACALQYLKVDLAKVSDEKFRFFENYHFIFDCSTGQER